MLDRKEVDLDMCINGIFMGKKNLYYILSRFSFKSYLKLKVNYV